MITGELVLGPMVQTIFVLRDMLRWMVLRDILFSKPDTRFP